MNILKRITLIILLFIVIGLVVSMFLPSSFSLERKIIIDADKEQIFKQVNDLKNWKNWAPWEVKDPSIFNDEQAYSSPSFGVGATFNWDSENDDLGKGNIKIIKSNKNEYIENKVDMGLAQITGTWAFNNLDSEVEVIWGVEIDFGFNPIAKFLGLFMEDQISPDYELGLQRLKSFTENLPKIHTVKVKKEKLDENQWFLSVRDTVNQMEMNNLHGKIYNEISQFMNEKDLELNSTPLVIYHFWSDTLIDIEVGIPVRDSTIIGNNEIKMNKIESGNVVTAIHYGAYDRLPETYFGINEWMRKNRVVVTGPPWELYITDPASEPNPDKWKTAIYFPIE
jgi:effector-binding domain-containing protein/ribosome-associated toxin RatA of RatAB toxin-antitoxin module